MKQSKINKLLLVNQRKTFIFKITGNASFILQNNPQLTAESMITLAELLNYRLIT